MDKVDGEEDISRRAKLWNGIAASSAGATMAEHMGPEEGEVDPAMIHQAQHMVLGIHGLLQAEVSKGLGAPTAPAPMLTPQDGQSTLASIIARAQQSAAPPPEAIAIPDPPPTAEGAGELSTAVDTSAPAADPVVPAVEANSTSTPPPLSLSWLSEEQTKLLEQAIAQAAAAAQAQAEAEAALEEEEEDGDEDEVQEGIEE